MVFLSMCYSLSVNMPRTDWRRRRLEERAFWRCSVLAQTRSLNKRVVESQKKIWKEGPRVSFIYSRSLKFHAVEKGEEISVVES